MQTNILSVKNLTKTFESKSILPFKKNSSFTAVNNVSFDLKKGEILAILGPNGAGKTTTLQILLSILKPTSGSITYFNKDFFANRSDILQHVAFASTYVKLPPRLTVSENLDIYGSLYGLNKQERRLGIEKYLKAFGMWNIKDKETGVLSAGQSARVMMAKAFLTNPKIVLLDEPTASLDPDIAQEIRKFILEQQKINNVSVIITSHNMDEVTEICDRVLVMKKGQIIANDTAQSLMATVSKCHVQFILDNQVPLIEFAKKNNMSFEAEKSRVSFYIDEHNIANLLQQMAIEGINYTHIAIEKPTLKDYFLTISKDNI